MNVQQEHVDGLVSHIQSNSYAVEAEFCCSDSERRSLHAELDADLNVVRSLWQEVQAARRTMSDRRDS